MDDEDRDFLVNGVRHGFDIVHNTPLPNICSANHSSSTLRSDVTSSIIADELARGRYVISDHQPDIVSPLGLVPKDKDDFRLIHDCSFPDGSSLNDNSVPMDKCSYETVDTAAQLMTPCCFMAKVDIKSAYRAVAISQQSWRATGLRWRINGHDQFLYDTRLPFGARPSPTIFHRISQFIKRCHQRAGYLKISVYQDDFIVFGNTYEECLEAWLHLINLILKLGFDINYKKLVAPSSQLIFLGITLNSETMTLSLPTNKLESINDTLASWRTKTRASKRQLQSLVGKLSHAAHVVRGGRTFLRRMFNTLRALKRPNHKTRITGALLQDIVWWQNFMPSFNGISACIPSWDAVTMMSDACDVGGGVFSEGTLYYTNWAADLPHLEAEHINHKEAAVAALGVIRFAQLYTNKTVNIYIDNQCAVSIINKCSSTCDPLMVILREMFWTTAKFNIIVKARYLPGNLNRFADIISRMHDDKHLYRLEHIFNEWHLCHSATPNAFDHISLLNHMSLASLLSVWSQVTGWRSRRTRYTSTYLSAY